MSALTYSGCQCALVLRTCVEVDRAEWRDQRLCAEQAGRFPPVPFWDIDRQVDATLP